MTLKENCSCVNRKSPETNSDMEIISKLYIDIRPISQVYLVSFKNTEEFQKRGHFNVTLNFVS